MANSVRVVADRLVDFGAAVYETVIPRNVRISEAPSFGQPITVYDPEGPGTEAYRNLATEVIARFGLK